MTSTEMVILDDTISSANCSIVSTGYTPNSFFDYMTNKGGEKDMMGLYELDIVDTKKHKLIEYAVRRIARGEIKAKMMVAKDYNLDLENEYLEIFVRCIGQWESRKPKEVKIVKEE